MTDILMGFLKSVQLCPTTADAVYVTGSDDVTVCDMMCSCWLHDDAACSICSSTAGIVEEARSEQ